MSPGFKSDQAAHFHWMKTQGQSAGISSEVPLPAVASESLGNRLLLDAGGLLALRVAFGGLSFVVTIILARTLGTEGFGGYSYAFAWTVLLGVPAILGMDQLLIREIATYQLDSQWHLIRGLLRMANCSVLFVSVCLAVVAAAFAWFQRGRWAPDFALTFWLSLLLLPLISATRVRQGALQGLQRVVLGSIPERLIQPTLLLGFVAVVQWKLNGMTASLAMGMNIVATLVAFVIGARWLQRTLPLAVKHVKPAYRNSTWLRSALSMLLFSSVGVVFSQADLLILGAIKGTNAVGLYSVADRGAEMLTMVMVAQSGAFASTAAALYAARDVETLQRFATRIARWNLLITLPLAAIFVFFGEWILLYAYGAQFTPARESLAILSLGQLVNVAMGLNALLLIMTGHETQAAVALGAGAVTNIVLNLLLVPAWGMEGAAIGNTCSIVVWNVLATFALYRKTGVQSTVFASAAH
jgi:O-antigen/teichoic acid export membrane protein